jgi:hypothetical protein
MLFRRGAHGFVALVLLALTPCGSKGAVAHQVPPAKSRITPQSRATPTRMVRHAVVRRPRSWLNDSVILTLYGRAFDTAPILGRLGMDGNMADVTAQAAPFVQGIRSQSGHKGVRIALHLIYGMATPCSPGSNCLAYLDDSGVDVVKQYIEPAARRGWLVILDTQLAESSPVQEVTRMIKKGYLRYDNVEVALDPEFRATPSQVTPGIPVGTVTAAELNAAERVLNGYAATHPLPHHKILLIHQFQFGMVQQRGSLLLHLPWVDPVLVMDGFGDPGVKAHVYHDLFGKLNAPRVTWRGIKLFYPNPYEQAGHADGPLMTWPQVLGHAPALDVDGRNYWVSPAPQVVVVA